ncbi:MAG: cytochrome c [Pseudomonadota bacterium]
MNKRSFIGLVLGIYVVAACQDNNSNTQARNSSPPAAQRAEVVKGAALYTQHCAKCHGAQGEGAPQWDIPSADGKFLPPPLDGSGHAWHHPSSVLREIIFNGSIPGKGNMPGWRDKLSLSDVDALIVWMQSLWPADIHNAWLEVEERTKP